MQASDSGCTAPSRFEEAGLTANHTSHRHTCAVVRHACLFNATIVPYGASQAEVEQAAAAAQNVMVRNIFNSYGKPFPLRTLHSMRPAAPGSAAARLLAREVEARGFSPCVPLVWRPVWAFTFGEQFANSISPLYELHAAKLIDDGLLLRPDLAAARRPSWYRQLFGTFSQQPLASLREIGTRCLDKDAQLKLRGGALNRFQVKRCEARCHARLLVCGFESLLDTHKYVPPRFTPWRAAQFVAMRVVGPGLEQAPSGPWRVLLVNRTQTENKDNRGLRRIANLPQLLELCEGWAVARCEAREFGRHGVAADVRAVRAADVLVGMHGSALDNALFMRRGAALIEARPYGFEGQWPDRYLKLLLAIETAVHYYQISAGSPQLSYPRPPYDVTAWDGWNRDTKLPWRALSAVLRAIFWVNRSALRYKSLPVHVWTSLPSPPRQERRRGGREVEET